MNPTRDKQKEWALIGGIGLLALAVPWLFPNYLTQFAFLWVMVVFALTWDLLGGQMGYNSFGNIVFFGIGAYACAVVQRDSGLSYFAALSTGLFIAAILATAVAAVLGAGVLGMRGHYFAICTLGLGVAAGEIASGVEYVGAGSGMVTPQYPGDIDERNLFYYFLFFAIAVATFFTLRRLYDGRFGLAINAIRDDEDKAEAMGLHTTRYKTVAWCVAAFFLALVGGGVGNLVGFIDPRDVAFAGATFGVWMVLMAILGGKGTIWGPVLGAAVFHLTQELFWKFLFGWQRVALGALIVLIVVFFPQGILGWARERWPHRFGHRVEPGTDEEGTA
ncbi:MAG: branched-chain amino acid ABC transporter permease [Gammaproteobacteria bacterium]